MNNAGIMYLGEAEIVAMTIYKRVMAVNHYGVVLLTQAFLPLLRHSKGRIVTMSSTGSEHFFYKIQPDKVIVMSGNTLCQRSSY